MNKYNIFLIVFGVLCFNMSQAQKNTINFDMGYGYAFQQNASGYVVNLQYLRALSGKIKTGLIVGHNYNEGRGLIPKDISSGVFPFRDYTNPLPLGGYNGAWDADSFTGIRLRSKPNHYFCFTLGAGVVYDFIQSGKNKVFIDMAGAYAIRDEMEIARLITADQIKFTNSSIFENAQIPVYRYSTYGDWMLRLGLGYSFQISKNMALRTFHAFTSFSGKGDILMNSSMGVEARF
ncbi:MAG: hypothetical protein KF852_13910 [Saprospiraceae bacterium]|nr:hypothetical protein [Saprospiraceae bacterium]